MMFERYEKWAKENSFYDPAGDLTYSALGVCGESGEFAEKVRKMQRDDGGKLTPDRREEMLKELGDVLFYLAMAARGLGSGLDEVARMNMEKIASRRMRNQMMGEGDDR